MNGRKNRKSIVTGIMILCLFTGFTGCKRNEAALEESGQTVQTESESTNEQEENPENVLDEAQAGLAPENQESGEQKNDNNETESTAAKDSDTPLLPNATGWAVQKYSDPYLSYEIPESWGKNDDESSDAMLFVFFQSKDPKVDYPSNINVQITQLDTGNQPVDIDYGSKEIQEEFHQFLISDMGLPTEAANGTFSVYQTKQGVYVYSLGFERKAMDNTMVHQTVYLPMNMQHSIVIWATDFKDGAKVSADEAALHLCETLKIVK